MQEKVISIQDLTQDSKNFNKGTDKGAKLMRKSFKKFGAGRSVLIDKDNRIIAGNKSTEAAAESGIKKVRVIETDGTELIAVKRTDVSLDSKEGRELALADNAATYHNLDWDIEQLQNISTDFADFDTTEWDIEIPEIDVEQPVFGEPSLQPQPSETYAQTTQTTTEQPQKQYVNAVEDDFNEEEQPKEERVKRGEVWQLGGHRLMCGDSTSIVDVQRLMDGMMADCVLTDPPFGNNVGYGRGQLGVRTIMNDADTKVLTSFFAPLDSALKKDSHCLVWVQWRTFSELEKAFEKYKLRTVVIWDKKQAGLSGGGFAEQYEMLCVFIKGYATQNYYSGNVWQVSREHDKREESEHPHKKPIEVLARALDLCSQVGGVILDLFGGSGSTLIACEQLRRKCYMMELDPHYASVIVSRWEKFTGKEAVKVC